MDVPPTVNYHPPSHDKHIKYHTTYGSKYWKPRHNVASDKLLASYTPLLEQALARKRILQVLTAMCPDVGSYIYRQRLLKSYLSGSFLQQSRVSQCGIPWFKSWCDDTISSYAVSVCRNSFHEEIKIRLKSGNDCYLSVQNLLSSTLLCKNTKINLYITIFLPVVWYKSEILSVTHSGLHTSRYSRIGCWGR